MTMGPRLVGGGGLCGRGRVAADEGSGVVAVVGANKNKCGGKRGWWGFVEGRGEQSDGGDVSAAARAAREWLLLRGWGGGWVTAQGLTQSWSKWRGYEWSDGLGPKLPRNVESSGVVDHPLCAPDVVLVEGEVRVVGCGEGVDVGHEGSNAVMAPLSFPRHSVRDNVGDGVDECYATV